MRQNAIEVPLVAVILPVDTFIDYYELLHVQPDAPAPVIKASYRAMMQKLNHHPDRGGDVGFAQLLNDAAKTLCNPDTRAHYDALREQHTASSRNNAGSRQQNGDGSRPAWGEPGGTPADFSNGKSGDTHSKSGIDEDTPKSEADNSSTDSGAIAAYNTALSARSHCLFCHAPYASQSSTAYTSAAYSYPARCRTCNGARTPIEQQPRSSNEELRAMHRQQPDGDVKLWRQWPVTSIDTAALYDFSPEGCALLCRSPLHIKQVVMLESHLFNAICTVRHCKDKDSASYLIGLEFLTLDLLAPPGALLNATA